MNDWAPTETRFTPRARNSRASSGVTDSGFASTVSSSTTGKAGEHPLERGGLGEGRRPAADEDGLHPGGEPPALPLQLGEERVRVRAVLLSPATDVTKSQ